MYQLDKVNEDFILKTTITNTGDPAYEAKLYVFHPSALSYIKTDTSYQVGRKTPIIFKKQYY